MNSKEVTQESSRGPAALARPQSQSSKTTYPSDNILASESRSSWTSESAGSDSGGNDASASDNGYDTASGYGSSDRGSGVDITNIPSSSCLHDRSKLECCLRSIVVTDSSEDNGCDTSSARSSSACHCWVNKLSAMRLLVKKRRSSKQHLDETVSEEEEDTDVRPSRPMSAYNIFFTDERAKIVYGSDNASPSSSERNSSSEDEEDHDGKSTPKASSKKLRPRKRPRRLISYRDLADIVNERWQKASVETLKKYRGMAENDAKRYKREVKEFQEREGVRRLARHFSYGACDKR